MNLAINSLKNDLLLFDPDTSIHKDIRAVLKVAIYATPELSKDESLIQLREELPPDVLYAEEHLEGFMTNFRILKDFLIYKGYKYTKYPGESQISWGLFSLLYDDQVDTERALRNLLEQKKCIKEGDQKRTKYNIQQSHAEKEYYSDLAHDVRSTFMTKEYFLEEEAGDNEEYIMNHQDENEDFQSNNKEKAKDFDEVVCKDEQESYHKIILGSASKIDTGTDENQDTFITSPRQGHIENNLHPPYKNDVFQKKHCILNEDKGQTNNYVAKESEPLKFEDIVVTYLSEDKVGLPQSIIKAEIWALQEYCIEIGSKHKSLYFTRK